jgi:hypothetical protein
MINETYTRYKQHSDRALRYAIRMGMRLYEAKRIVGPNRFMDWVHDNCPFSHSTANNYMYVARSNLTFARLANLAVQGTVTAIEDHVRKKSAAQYRRQDEKDRKEDKAESATRLPKTLAEAYEKRDRKRQSFRDKIAFKKAQTRAAQQARSEEYQAIGLSDPALAWPRPHDDASCLVVEWQQPNDVIQGIYVWLPDNAHALAEHDTIVATGGHWKGGAALRYHWIIYTFDRAERTASVHLDPGEQSSGAIATRIDGMTWEHVQEKLLELGRDATGVSKCVALPRDPETAAILENWRDTRQYRNPSRRVGS